MSTSFVTALKSKSRNQVVLYYLLAFIYTHVQMRAVRTRHTETEIHNYILIENTYVA